MKKKKLLTKTMAQFSVCVAILMLLSTPLFYWLTKRYYAEDLMMVIENNRTNPDMIPVLDLEEDVMHGIMIQFGLITLVLGTSIVLVMNFISSRLWKPFNKTLGQLDKFKLEAGVVPSLPDSDIKEFTRLNNTLTRLMTNSLNSYNMQKEFTENASHELQTPLAVFQSKLDVLLQNKDLTRRQAEIIQDLYQVSNRLAHLNKNLLLLARIENNQYANMEDTDIVAKIDEVLPLLETLSDGIAIKKDIQQASLTVKGNGVLIESLINNLVVNALRHNKMGGEILITLRDNSLIVSNTSDEGPLDGKSVFNRFNHSSGNVGGNGLGLAIVKAICEYHKWRISYSYKAPLHIFTVKF